MGRRTVFRGRHPSGEPIASRRAKHPPQRPLAPIVRYVTRDDHHDAHDAGLFKDVVGVVFIPHSGEAGGGGGIEQMTLKLMLCAFILLALGGCQNPSRIQAASSHSAAMD